MLSRHIRRSISSSSAKKFGSEGLAEWLAKAEQFEYRFGSEHFTLHEIIAKIVEQSLVEKLEELHLTGDKEKRVMNARVIVPLLGDSRLVMSIGGRTPRSQIPATPLVLALPPPGNPWCPCQGSVRSRETYSRIEWEDRL
jgi:hypothetical protein